MGASAQRSTRTPPARFPHRVAPCLTLVGCARLSGHQPPKKAGERNESPHLRATIIATIAFFALTTAASFAF